MSRALRWVGVALLLLLVLVGGAVALSWAPDRPVESLKARWAPPPSVFVPVAGMQVHLRDEGPRDDPLPIVLLHGTSASLHTWDGWAAELSKTRRVIRFDQPGFGLTGPFADGHYATGRYPGFVLAVLDALGVQRAVLAGNSFGGEVAWQTALAAPGRIDRLVLVDAAGYPLNPQSVPIGFRLARLPLLNRLFESVLPRGVIEASVRNVYGEPARVTPELVDRYYELTLREGNRAALAGRLRAWLPGAEAARIRELKLPTLILWGGRDRLLPPADGASFHADIAGSELVLFDALGHVPHEEDPAATVASVSKFVGDRH
ncbi:alpha/beta fold hydrolase [Rivibacter subsaxonicus]|uniref:Pimeloyl-ACP methyl ester carboxylesterase n=1 Tax=Rivibacter subsaxonicus TaxID=457575 RepID=A0A4Q7V773_9BURK|nr:alpha/beta hydrolase [Rivibacter subsaxonicus]RZT91427.1 pimeloyl-ACP methyl ester carboxylesterase [Rivibacter subsaxonicus]